jgi:cyclophilin family peptidyl-prolyl cis-trans isomerase
MRLADRVPYVASIVLAASLTCLVPRREPPAPLPPPSEPLAPPRIVDMPPPVSRIAIETTQGALHCTLFPDVAPKTVANFAALAINHFYDGLTFHRVIPGFVIHGGDPKGNGTGGPGYKFDDELSSLEFVPGTLAMANAGPNTNGSQFFIMDGEASWLRGHHTIFGRCAELDVIHAIASVPRNTFDYPATPVTITRVVVE